MQMVPNTKMNGMKTKKKDMLFLLMNLEIWSIKQASVVSTDRKKEKKNNC